MRVYYLIPVATNWNYRSSIVQRVAVVEFTNTKSLRVKQDGVMVERPRMIVRLLVQTPAGSDQRPGKTVIRSVPA